MKKYFMLGLTLFLFPMIAYASEKQITCTYSTPDNVVCDKLKGISFSITVYNDKAVFDGFHNCPGEVKNDGCEANEFPQAYIRLPRNFEKNVWEWSYNKNTKKFDCPNLAYGVDAFGGDLCTLAVTSGSIEMEGNYPLNVSRKVFNQNNTKQHQEICKKVSRSYDKNLGGDVTFTFYYDGRYNGDNLYSMEVTYSKTTIKSQSSNKDLGVTFINGKQLTVPEETVNTLFKDYDPNKNDTKKCEETTLYLNYYQDSYKLELEKNGTNSELEEPSDPTNPSKNPGIKPSEATCDYLLGTKSMNFLKEILGYIQIVGVVLGIILGMSEFIGAVISGEADANKKASKRLVIRIAMVGALLLVPALLKFILNTFGVAGNSICIL